ncbi:MAG: response regulator [Chloroflexaceae bacterium]|nr:response regulator [Chloroflexaceae bacterium]NJL34681.1 response regulator [Chloroflexaceae bacterium]NJO05918.1 response regulator [Chloroflexaceae bacterium]
MNLQVLVVDDESVTRRVVTHTLRALAEVEVLTAEDGSIALDLAQSATIALAIIDINLPDMDGFELMRRLKAMPHLQHVPMIAFTARNHPDDQHMALEVGAAGFLYKPFSTQEMRELVRLHLGLQ